MSHEPIRRSLNFYSFSSLQFLNHFFFMLKVANKNWHNLGIIYFVARRATFLIERGGRIAYIWHKVKPASHAEQVLSKVKELGL